MGKTPKVSTRCFETPWLCSFQSVTCFMFVQHVHTSSLLETNTVCWQNQLEQDGPLWIWWTQTQKTVASLFWTIKQLLRGAAFHCTNLFWINIFELIIELCKTVFSFSFFSLKQLPKQGVGSFFISLLLLLFHLCLVQCLWTVGRKPACPLSTT